MKKIFTFLLSLYKDEYVVLNKLKKKKMYQKYLKKIIIHKWPDTKIQGSCEKYFKKKIFVGLKG